MILNTTKTVFMNFHYGRKVNIIRTATVNTRFLGVQLDTALNFKDHVMAMIAKSNSKLINGLELDFGCS